MCFSVGYLFMHINMCARVQMESHTNVCVCVYMCVYVYFFFFIIFFKVAIGCIWPQNTILAQKLLHWVPIS